MTTIDLLGRLDAETTALRQRMQLLTRQVASGKRADAPGDIAQDLPRATTLRAEIARRGAYDQAISATAGKLEGVQTAMSGLRDIASRFADSVGLKLNSGNPDSITFAATEARAALVEVGHLLNTQYAGEYVFGGSDGANPPVPNADGLATSTFATRIATAVGALGTSGAAGVAAQTMAIAQDDTAGATPFSAFVSDPATGLSEPRRSVPTGDGRTIAYGLFANRNAAAVSTGNTTGSWARDLMRGLASIAALKPSDAATAGEFDKMVGDIRSGLVSARNGLADETGALGQVQAKLEDARKTHTLLTDSATQQLAGVEDMDLAAVLTRLQGTQTALQASYTAMARLSTLTLTNYLK